MANSIALHRQSTLPAIQDKAAHPLTRLATQSQRLYQFQSSLTVLMPNQASYDSYWGQLARWHGQLSWWLKLSLGLSVVTVAVGIGFLCNALILIASFVSIIYASLVFLLENHHHVSLLREKQLTAEVQRLEQTLVDALEHFRAIEHSLREVLTSLYALNHQQAEDIQAFQAQIVQLQTETSRLSELNTSVHLSRNALLESTTHFSAVVGDMESTMMTLGQTLSDEIGKLDKTDAKLTTTNTSLQADQTR